MDKHKRRSAYEKWEIIAPIIEEKISVNSVSKKHKISTSVINTWIHKYKAGGFVGLESSKSHKSYPAELRIAAVEDVVVRGMSPNSVLNKYNISSRNVLDGWISSYNRGNELVKISKGRADTTMTKGRKTTLEERIEIAQYTIARDNDYQATMEKYKVSYQQVYSWVKKYEAHGMDGLQDGRGKNKEKVELSELELLRLENKQLKERNEYLEIKDAIEKKLIELKHRYGRSR